MSGPSRAERRVGLVRAGWRYFFAPRPWYHPSALLRRAFFYYLAVLVALYFLQNSLLYPRWISGAVGSEAEGVERAAAVGLQAWHFPGITADSLRGYVSPDFEQPNARGTVVVLHGNAGCAFDRTYYPDAFSRRGFRTFLYEYPGYGGRSGSPGGAKIVAEARAVIRHLAQTGSGPIYLWGESVGAGVAAWVCQDSTLPVQGLVLLTPWDSLVHTAAFHYPIFPVAWLIREKYDSVENLARFTGPVCVICSAEDRVIPAPLGLALFRALPGPKKSILHPGVGHNDWPNAPELEWWDAALDFIAPPSLSRG